MKRRLVLLVAVFLLILTPCRAQFPETILIGTVYNIFHEEFVTDEEYFRQVDRDIALMKDSGINLIMVFPLGEWDPQTKQLKWKRTDYLIRKIEQAGMKFAPLMLKEEQCSHYIPIWKFKEIEGLWNECNVNNGNENNRDNIDFADARIAPLVESYFGEVANRYAKSPALSFYNIWNEPHYSSVAPHVVDRFRQWLKQKYDSLAALRHAWAEAYSDWSEVSPFLTENWKSSMPQIDWIEFRNDLNGMLLGELIRTLRKFDSTHVVNANPVGSVWASFAPLGAYNIDDWPIADKNDIHGISYYPDGWERSHDLEPCPFWLHNLAFNAVRSAARGKNFILTELYTNTQNGLALNGYLDKQSISLLAWTALANDCKGMIYWKWLPFMRGRQTLGRGLCQVDGKLAPRGEAVKDIAVVMRKYGQMLCKARLRKPQAAILVDMTGLIKTLEQTTEPATNKFMYESYAGLFKALHEGNVSVDMVRMDRSLDGETLKGYNIIYLPFQIVMRREVAEVLKAYVRQGGWVVADARTATIDELDFAYPISPGAGLDELFGATRSDWIGAKTVYKVHMEESSGSSPTDFYGRFFREKIELHGDVQTLGTFVDTHTPAITRKGYGKGVAILSAVPLGASYYGLPDNPVNRLVLEYANEAGVVPDARFVSETQGDLNLKVHESEDDIFVYAINSNTRPLAGSLEVQIGKRTIRSVTEILSDRSMDFLQKGGVITIPIKSEGGDVAVFHLKAR